MAGSDRDAADRAAIAAAADRLLACAGLAPVSVSVSRPALVLPSVFRIDVAAAAAVAAATAAAALVAQARTGSRPAVAVDGRAAQVAFRSERYLRVGTTQPAELWAPLSGDYPSADGGWVKIHANFAHHAEAACRALDVPARREALAEAIAARPALEVESAVIDAGGAAAALRDEAAWIAHPQGAADRARPVLDLERIGAADARPWPSPRRATVDARRGAGPKPLTGVRVLDLSRVIAGPVCGRVLAAHGADVLAVTAAHLPQIAPLVIDTGFGKRSTFLDLRHPRDRDAFDELLADADVVLDAFRPGALNALGYGPEQLAARSPGVVVVELRAYGRTGPWAMRRGYDSLVQLAAGIAAAGAAASGVARPVPLPCQALDHATGWLAALAATAGVLRQRRDGGSWRAGLSLSATAAWLSALGRVDGDGLAVPDPGLDDVADLIVETPSPHGRLRHVAMAGSIDAIPTGWDGPPPVLGQDGARWRAG